MKNFKPAALAKRRQQRYGRSPCVYGSARVRSSSPSGPRFARGNHGGDYFGARLGSTPAALAFVGILAVVAIGLQTRNSPPALHSPGTNRTVFRSNAIIVTAPSGDIRQAPSEIRWQTDPGAAKYEVRLLEVDGTELWRTATAESAVQLPALIRARIVPAKTLLCQVLAFDATGRQVAISDEVRFRVLPKPYQP